MYISRISHCTIITFYLYMSFFLIDYYYYFLIRNYCKDYVVIAYVWFNVIKIELDRIDRLVWKIGNWLRIWSDYALKPASLKIGAKPANRRLNPRTDDSETIFTSPSIRLFEKKIEENVGPLFKLFKFFLNLKFTLTFAVIEWW